MVHERGAQKRALKYKQKGKQKRSANIRSRLKRRIKACAMSVAEQAADDIDLAEHVADNNIIINQSPTKNVNAAHKLS